MTLNRRQFHQAVALGAGVAAKGALCFGTVGAASTPAGAAPARQQVAHGRLERWDDFRSRHIDPRPIEVWLPPGYDGRKPHAVLYMHDGQMLFDPGTTWNKQAWELDRKAAPLLAEGRLRDFIVVAPWNNGKWRFAEYFPQAWLPHLDAEWRKTLAERALQGAPRSDAYLRFLVEELKPAIDARYATRREREHTMLAGSSMGGLISLYGLCEHPTVFGGAACFSTHWIGGFERNEVVPAAALRYLREKLPAPDSVRLWMDRGDQELDAKYDQAQARVDALMAEKGFQAPRFVSKVFAGTGHNEGAWRDRLPEVLSFLLGL
ncbi:alpha/beta hydrolase [Inhella sp.]|uniref:alpha/beta hydrolase n=1 Tax=Inhella sp. TaxID=1921806 RepID=UPI0035AEA587